MFVTGEGIHEIVRKRIDQQKAGEEKASPLSISQRQPQRGKGCGSGKKKSNMAGNHQIVSRNNIGLGRSDPEVDNVIHREANKSARTFPDELAHLLLFFLHEANFAEFLKSFHGFGIVPGMLSACPKTHRLFVIGHVDFEWKIVANKDELAKNFIVAHQPRTDQYASC